MGERDKTILYIVGSILVISFLPSLIVLPLVLLLFVIYILLVVVLPFYLLLKLYNATVKRHQPVNFRFVDKIDEWLYDFSRRIQLRNSRPKIFKRDDVSDYARESGHDFFQYQFDKGIRGEANVFHLLEAMPYYTKIMTNLYIPTEKGTTEIDIVLIAPWGIYVIESKNYSGKIYGDQKYRNWHHYLGGKKYEFLNPIIQNQLHIDALEKVLPNLTLHSLIIFGNKTELKKLSVDKDQVILVYELEDYMEKRSKNVIYSQKNIDTIYQYLQQYAYKSDEEKQAHITNLKRRQQN